MQQPPLQKAALRLWHLLNQRPVVVSQTFRLFSTAQSIADELLKPDETPEPLEERLDALNAALDHQMFVDTLNLSNGAGRKVFGLYEWAAKRPGFLDEVSFAAVADFLGRRKDFKAVRVLLLDRTIRRFPIGMRTFRIVVDRLARAGRPTQLIDFFHEIDIFGFDIDRREGLSVVVSALCDHGFVGHAESLVKKTADRLFPDDAICETLVKGWCTAGKLVEARRLAGEVARGGFELGAVAYNAILDCVCKLCRQKDPFQLRAEADTVLVEMETAGVPRDSGTFQILISNLCKIRKTQDALEIFKRMPEWSCLPDSDTFLALVKSLYQAARVAEGDEMLDSMKLAGFQLTIKDYYGFIRILCGIERVEHAMNVFARMKEEGFKPGTQTYELLIARLYAHGKVEAANSLYQEAVDKGVTINNREYKIEPRFVKEEKKKKKKAKRETLPMKMERKRKRLRKLRLSFVKKPKKFMRRAY
ncbi:pentatricopeptide repeat-containing protein PNM1, mitochondrial-like [Nymphaea colorata]|nr:pentatricopeptide repeat-containing protein PNM1, mitochondrial-like [Nymphaea colorata]